MPLETGAAVAFPALVLERTGDFGGIWTKFDKFCVKKRLVLYIVCPAGRISYEKSEVSFMEKPAKKMILSYLIAAGAGVLLHFLYSWFPNPVLALISPARESVWEHVKLLYFPLLGTALVLGRGSASARTPWLLSIPVVCLAMVGAGYLYHIPMRGESLWVDLALYFLLLGVGFLLPRTLWPLCEWPGTEKAAAVLTGLLGAAIVLFTFFPPAGALFSDLTSTVRTFLTIPV